jgi:antitoxin component YwqK of YwqJK toxin-antitoxin module
MHKDGSLRAEGTVVDGLLEGWWVHWWQSGLKRAEGEMRRGRQEGPWKFWHQDGSRDREATGIYADDQRDPGESPGNLLTGA